MRKMIICVAVILCKYSHAQKFFIVCEDKYSRGVFEKKLTSLGFDISDSLNSDYKLQLTTWQTSKINSMYKGNVAIFDKVGKEISRSKDVRRGAVAINGYNASFNISKVISEDYLREMTSGIKRTQSSKIASSGLAEEISKLKKLYDDGTISKEEFDAAKKKLLEK